MKPFALAALQKKLTDVLENGQPIEKPTNLEIREEIKNLTNLPVMAAAHSKLLMLLSKADEEVDMRQVSSTMELDPALSSKVIRTCRSAYFGFQGNLISQAVAFLGVAVIRKIVQTAVIYNAFGEAEEQAGTAALTMDDLWRHSLAVGMAMEVIGKAEYELLGITHAECDGELAVHWDLPAEIRTAITSHHSPAQSALHRRLASMVHIADIAVRQMEIGYAGDPFVPEMDPYAKRLAKSVDEIVQHKDDFVSQCDSILGGGDSEEG